MFYSLDCEWNLTLDFFQTNLWVLIPNNIPSGVHYYTWLAKPHPHAGFHSWQDTRGQKSFDTVWNLTHLHLKEMKQVWCSWDWSGILERHKEGYNTVYCYISFSFPTPLYASFKLYPWPISLLLNIYVRNCENRLISVCLFSLSFSEKR